MRRIEASIVPQILPASGRGTSFRSSCFADIQKNYKIHVWDSGQSGHRHSHRESHLVPYETLDQKAVGELRI